MGPPPHVAAALVALSMGHYAHAGRALLAQAESVDKNCVGAPAQVCPEPGSATHKAGWVEAAKASATRRVGTEVSASYYHVGNESAGKVDDSKKTGQKSRTPGGQKAGHARVQDSAGYKMGPQSAEAKTATDVIKSILFPAQPLSPNGTVGPPWSRPVVKNQDSQSLQPAPGGGSTRRPPRRVVDLSPSTEAGEMCQGTKEVEDKVNLGGHENQAGGQRPVEKAESALPRHSRIRPVKRCLEPAFDAHGKWIKPGKARTTAPQGSPPGSPPPSAPSSAGSPWSSRSTPSSGASAVPAANTARGSRGGQMSGPIAKERSKWTVAKAGRHSARAQMAAPTEQEKPPGGTYACLGAYEDLLAAEAAEARSPALGESREQAVTEVKPLSPRELEEFVRLTGKPVPEVKYLKLQDLARFKTSTRTT